MVSLFWTCIKFYICFFSLSGDFEQGVTVGYWSCCCVRQFFAKGKNFLSSPQYFVSSSWSSMNNLAQLHFSFSKVIFIILCRCVSVWIVKSAHTDAIVDAKYSIYCFLAICYLISFENLWNSSFTFIKRDWKFKMQF